MIVHLTTSHPADVFQAIEDVQGLTSMGTREGREMILKYLRRAGIDHNALKIFHVTGTNGKGSVCHMLASVLQNQFGQKVGLFTSPHLINITERFRINDVCITKHKLNAYYQEILDDADAWGLRLSFFEIQVICAVKFFLDEQVDLAVIEVGLGGTYDGTNIWEQPLATYITSIALEHQHILGKTRASILRNKLGIAKKNCPLFTPFDNKIISDYCQKIGAIHIGTKYQIPNTESQMSNTKYTQLTNLPGKHQMRNATLVLRSLMYLGYDEDKIREGLQHVIVPGRMQWITPRVLVDTANNAESIRSVVSTLGGDFFRDARRIIVFGSTQPDVDTIVHLGASIPCRRIVFVGGFHRATPPDKYADCSGHQGEIFLSIQEAFDTLLSDENNVFLVIGSLYLVGETMKYFKYKI